jgi:hypothetical protein
MRAAVMRLRDRSRPSVLAVTALAVLAAASPTYASGAKPVVRVSASHITSQSATIKAKINPEGSTTRYEIVFWRGCTEGQCERAPARAVATGHLAASHRNHTVTVELTGLTPGEPNNEYWVVATNSSGSTESPHRQFATPK